MIVIDGSQGEGGGQVLRTALTLACLTGQTLQIERIRANRPKPGLRPQHLTAVHAAAAICGAKMEGDALSSSDLVFVPSRPPEPAEYVFDVAESARHGSAGSVGLVLQTVILPLALSGGSSHLTLRGGTHVPWSPSAHYLEHVYLPTLAHMGVQVTLDLTKWGFYPAGGGELHVTITGHQGALQPLVITEPGEIHRVWGTAAVSNLPAHIPQRMANRAHNVLAESGLDARIEPRRLRGAGPGAGISIFVECANATTGFTAYGRKGLPSEQVAEDACSQLLAHHESGAAVDPHLADQLLLPMVLAEGRSCVTTSRVSQHLLTNLWVVQRFLKRDAHVEGELGTVGALTIKGDTHD